VQDSCRDGNRLAISLMIRERSALTNGYVSKPWSAWKSTGKRVDFGFFYATFEGREPIP
jgi:hypothetical protein